MRWIGAVTRRHAGGFTRDCILKVNKTEKGMCDEEKEILAAHILFGKKGIRYAKT